MTQRNPMNQNPTEKTLVERGKKAITVLTFGSRSRISILTQIRRK